MKKKKAPANTILLPAEVFVKALKIGLLAASKDDSRPHLNGVTITTEKIDRKQMMSVLATDGHCGIRYRRLVEPNEYARHEYDQPDQSCYIPGSNCEALLHAIAAQRKMNWQERHPYPEIAINYKRRVARLDIGAFRLSKLDDVPPPLPRLFGECREQVKDGTASWFGIGPRIMTKVMKVFDAAIGKQAAIQVSLGNIRAQSGRPVYNEPIHLFAENYEASVEAIVMPMIVDMPKVRA